VTEISLESAIQFLVSQGQWWALAVLFASSILEYVFPPFPGDTVTLAGAVLAYVGGWHPLYVLLALTLGSLAGSALDFWFGLKALTPERLARSPRLAARSASIDRVLAAYRRFGPAFLLLNRFMPGVRALFFVAAGMAGIPLRAVLLYSAASSLAWNMMLMAAGFLIGDNIPLLESLFSTWSSALWLLLAAAALWLLARHLRRRRSNDP